MDINEITFVCAQFAKKVKTFEFFLSQGKKQYKLVKFRHFKSQFIGWSVAHRSDGACCQSNHLSSIPRTYWVEWENQLLQIVLLYQFAMACMSCLHPQQNSNNKKLRISYFYLFALGFFLSLQIKMASNLATCLCLFKKSTLDLEAALSF